MPPNPTAAMKEQIVKLPLPERVLGLFAALARRVHRGPHAALRQQRQEHLTPVHADLRHRLRQAVPILRLRQGRTPGLPPVRRATGSGLVPGEIRAANAARPAGNRQSGRGQRGRWP